MCKTNYDLIGLFKIIIILTIIIILVVVCVILLDYLVVNGKIVNNNCTTDIATTIGGISALIVQSLCATALYFTLIEQKKANDIQIKKIDLNTKLSNFKQLTSNFYHLMREFRAETMSNKSLTHYFSDNIAVMEENPQMLNEMLYSLSSFLLSLQEYIEEVKDENIQDEQKELLLKKLKLFIKTDFIPNTYKHIKQDWKTKHNIEQQYEEIQKLLQNIIV